MKISEKNSEESPVNVNIIQGHNAYQIKKTFKVEYLSDGDLSESSSFNEDEECGRV